MPIDTHLGFSEPITAAGSVFEAGDDPGADAKWNIELENYFVSFKNVDAVPVVGTAGLMLFFTGNVGEDRHTGDARYGWGIWRASAVAEDATASYGLDFVVYADGTWSVGAGYTGSTDGYEHQFVGADADASVPYTEAWS